MSGAVTRRRADLIVVGLALLLLASVLMSLTLGRYEVPLGQIVDILSGLPWATESDRGEIPWIVVMVVRLPRILLVAMCGMGLGLAGAAMQGVFRNPLVGPEICGITAGAAFGGVLAILLGLSLPAMLGLAFALGLGSLVIAFGLARLGGADRILAFVLAGFVTGAFFSALIGLAQYFADPRVTLPSIVYWLLGSFAGASFEQVQLVAIVTIL